MLCGKDEGLEMKRQITATGHRGRKQKAGAGNRGHEQEHEAGAE
jgi:hypothetical protein